VNRRRCTITQRKGTEVLLHPLEGNEADFWSSTTAVEKVPKLNLAAAIAITENELLLVPALELRRGEAEPEAFTTYYVANFRGGNIVEDMARKLFDKVKEPRDEPPPESQKKKEVADAPVPTSPSQPQELIPTMGLSATSFAELEEKISQRNNRFRVENDALRRENTRLKSLWDKKTVGVRKNGPDAS